jgi:hypothetical protein
VHKQKKELLDVTHALRSRAIMTHIYQQLLQACMLDEGREDNDHLDGLNSLWKETGVYELSPKQKPVLVRMGYRKLAPKPKCPSDRVYGRTASIVKSNGGKIGCCSRSSVKGPAIVAGRETPDLEQGSKNISTPAALKINMHDNFAYRRLLPKQPALTTRKRELQHICQRQRLPTASSSFSSPRLSRSTAPKPPSPSP